MQKCNDVCSCLVSEENMDASGGEDSPIYSPVSADVEPFSNDPDYAGESDDYDDVVNYTQAAMMWPETTDVVASFFSFFFFNSFWIS